MHTILRAALLFLHLATMALAAALEPRQAFPVNGSCQAFDVPAPQAFESFVQLLYVAKNVTGAFGAFGSADLTQHDPFLAGGDGAQFAAGWARANITLLNYGVLQANDSVPSNRSMAHYVYQGEGLAPVNVVDVFRMSGSCVNEHWGVLQVPGQPVAVPAAGEGGSTDASGTA